MFLEYAFLIESDSRLLSFLEYAFLVESDSSSHQNHPKDPIRFHRRVSLFSPPVPAKNVFCHTNRPLFLSEKKAKNEKKAKSEKKAKARKKSQKFYLIKWIFFLAFGFFSRFWIFFLAWLFFLTFLAFFLGKEKGPSI